MGEVRCHLSLQVANLLFGLAEARRQLLADDSHSSPSFPFAFHIEADENPLSLGVRLNDVGNPRTALLRQSLGQQSCAARDIVALNAGAAIYVSGVAASLEEGYARAQALIQQGAASAKLNALVAFSQQFSLSS